MPSNAIQGFLYNTFGYGQLDNLTKGIKSPDVAFREFMDGTILGTFGRRSCPSIDCGPLGSTPAWKKRFITAPHIYETLQLEDKIKAGKQYLY